MQTKDGALKAKQTIIKKYGADHWSRIGTIGGGVKVPKGFAVNRELASTAGAIGGSTSRRRKKDAIV